MTYAKSAHQPKKATNHWPRSLPSFPKNDYEYDQPKIDPSHFAPLGSWSLKKMQASLEATPFMMTWVRGDARNNVPFISHGEGVYLVDYSGKKYLDWTSQAVCANLGHDLPESVVKAAEYQMRNLPFVYGGCGLTEVRVRLNQLLDEILPADLTAAVFPSSGGEANEAAIMMARRYTGKRKVLSWYRAYHGATGNAASATGDSRRWYGGESNAGFVKVFNPFPLFFTFNGATEEERTEQALNMLEEQILNEGPDNIACMIMESIVGAGGCLVMPPGYMQGVRAILTKYEIVMICDEVMVGFGRTGKLFGFLHYDGVLPDIVTCAKGISSSSIPLSMVACSRKIMEFFDDKPLGYGSTYQAHPVALACAYENIKYLIQQDIVGKVQRLAPLFEARMRETAESHPCIKQYRCVGLFGCYDIKETNGSNPKLQHDAAPLAFLKYKKSFMENGLAGIHRFPHIHVAPPLNITEDELLDGFRRHNKAISTLNYSLGYDVNIKDYQYADIEEEKKCDHY